MWCDKEQVHANHVSDRLGTVPYIAPLIQLIEGRLLHDGDHIVYVVDVQCSMSDMWGVGGKSVC